MAGEDPVPRSSSIAPGKALENRADVLVRSRLAARSTVHETTPIAALDEGGESSAAS